MADTFCSPGLDSSAAAPYTYSNDNKKGKQMSIASEVREYQRQQGEQPAQRGRVSVAAVQAFLLHNQYRARQIARQFGLEVPARGRLSNSTIVTIAREIR